MISAARRAGVGLVSLEWGRGVCAHRSNQLLTSTRGGRVVGLGCRRSLYMVSPQTVSTCPFQHKLQILLHGVTANSLYLSFSA